MSVSHLLEDFGAFTRGDTVEMTDVLLEEERLEAFEKGYQAGWDDSAKAASDTAGRVSIEFSQAIADMALTYEEAFNGMLTAVHPLISQVVRTVLPTLAQEALAPRLAEIISDQIAQHGRQDVVISAAPEQAEALRAIELPTVNVPVSISADPVLSTHQIQIAFSNGQEQEIDLQTTIAQISDAIDSYFNTGPTDEQRKTA